MSYKFDIFLSYQNDEIMGSWVSDHLLPFMGLYVGNRINRKAKIFFDRTGIPPGDTWPLKLQNALARSRCLVGVWNPLYFDSDWCRRECAAMLYREKCLKLREGADSEGLVVPINVFDGKHFPERARSIQSFDLRDYWYSGPAFAGSPLYIDFQAHLKKFAKYAERAIRRAPAWQSTWQESSWYDIDTSDLMPPPIENFDFPGLDR